MPVTGSEEARQALLYQPNVLFGGSPVWLVNLPFFIGRALIAVVLVVAGNVGTMYGFPIVAWVMCAGIGIVVLNVLWRVIETRLTRFLVDAERLTYRRGAITRVTGSVELYRIQTVECSTSLWQRMLGFGTLIVFSSDANHPRWEIAGVRDVNEKRVMLNRAAIALREKKGIREVAMGRI